MSVKRSEWMMEALPAVYAEGDGASGEYLSRLLQALAVVFFEGDAGPALPVAGLEAQIKSVPALFLPLDDASSDGRPRQPTTPDRFLHWLARWLSFTPYEHLEFAALRRVLANIVPLYNRRGTSFYLERLLNLAFAETVSSIAIDDRPRNGFTLGASRVGQDTRLARGLPFFFSVSLTVRAGAERTADIERRLRAVIDFAKPAHTSYELRIDYADTAAHS